MRIILFEYQNNINLNNQGILETAIKQIIFLSNERSISLFLSKNDEVAKKITEEFDRITNKVSKFEIITDLESNSDFLEILKKGNSLIVTIFPSDNTFCDFLKEKSDPTKKTECVFGQIGSVKIINLKRSLLIN